MKTKCQVLSNGDCVDLRANIDSVWLRIPAKSSVKIPTGLTVRIPEGHIGKVRPLTALSLCGLEAASLTYSPNYQGEISVFICNIRNDDQYIKACEKIAELFVLSEEWIHAVRKHRTEI